MKVSPVGLAGLGEIEGGLQKERPERIVRLRNAAAAERLA